MTFIAKRSVCKKSP